MNRIFLYLLPIILIIPSLTYADGPYLNIPPTNAFDKINGDNGTVHAANFSMPLNIKGGNNVSVKANNATHTITISASLASGGAGSYNTTSANNTPVNINGNILNFINGTGNPISIVNSGTKVNITISGSSASGSVTGSQNIGKGTTSTGVLSTATATTIRGKNVTSLRPDLITINTSNSTDVNLSSPFKSNDITCAANNFVNAFSNSTGIYNCALPTATGVTSLNFTTSSDFDFRSVNRNVTYTTLDGSIFTTHIKPNVVLTNESAQIIFKALTLNQGILGGNLDVAGFGLSNSGHVSTIPSITGTLCQINQTSHCGTDLQNGTIIGSQNVGHASSSVGVLSTASSTTIKGKNVTGTSPITVTSTNSTDFAIGCPTCGTLSSAITSINSQTGPAVNIVASTGNITITNSTNQVKINTGNNLAYLALKNNFTNDNTIATTKKLGFQNDYNPYIRSPSAGSLSFFTSYKEAMRIFPDQSITIGNFTNSASFVDPSGGTLQLIGNSTVGTLDLYGFGGVFAQRATRYDGTAGTPTTLLNGENIFAQNIRGYDGSAVSTTAGNFRYVTVGDWNNTSHGVKIDFRTTPSKSTTLTTVLSIMDYGTLQLVPITDPIPSKITNNDLWWSSTNADVLKYRSSGTTYNIQSTKNFLNFTASSNKTGVAGFNMLGDGVTLTPAVTGRAEITVIGYGTQSTAASGGAVQIRQITGGCPANGAAVTGSALGSNEKMTMSATTTKVPFSLTAQVTGLSLGTKYCFELTQQSITSGTFTIFNVVWSAKEI